MTLLSFLVRPSMPPTDPHRYYREPRSRRRRRTKPQSRALLGPLVYSSVALFLAVRFLLGPPVRIHVPAASHPVYRPPAHDVPMRPPQFENHAPANPYIDERTLQALADVSADDPAPMEPHQSETRPRPLSLRDGLPNVAHARRPIKRAEQQTRTCYHSAPTGDALCVHVPFCVRHDALVYLSDTLRCAAYTNQQGRMGTLSMTRCVDLERELESLAEIEHVEHKPMTWLQHLTASGNVLWFEGDTIFVRMSARAKSVANFADRIFMLHHVLQRPERYGMGAISNVVIAADEEVARKIRYTKSWHHGLLAAMVYPNKLIYSHREIRDMVHTLPTQTGEIRVYVPSGLWDIAKGKQVPCFRRAALPGAIRNQLFLSEDVFPGVIEHNSTMSSTRYRDADVFRTLLFQSLGHQGPPRIKRHVLYLHRQGTRRLSPGGVRLLEDTLKGMAHKNKFSYELLDTSRMTFPQQIRAVAGAGVVVGVHGTQMLNTLFLPSKSAIVEIFPYGFSNRLFQGGSGVGLYYGSHQIVHGDDFEKLSNYASIAECCRSSRECRNWYQSDQRTLDFGPLDGAAVGKLVQDGIEHVNKNTNM